MYSEGWMRYLQLVKGGMVAMAIGMSPVVNAVSGITITGELVGKSPDVVLPAVADTIANVKPVSFKASQGAGAGCLLTSSVEFAKAHLQKNGDLLCLFEWVLPSGLTSNAGVASGYFANYGDQEVGYNVSIFSGSNQEKILVESGRMSVQVARATLPLIISYSTTVSSGTKPGKSVTSYSRNDLLKTIQVSVEPKPYPQRVLIKSIGSCDVAEGAGNCSISAASTTVSNDDSIKGIRTFEVEADASNGYFTTQKIVTKDLYDLGWDYRAPSLNDYNMQAVSAGNEKLLTIPVNEQTIVISNEKAILVVDTPHYGKEGTWWHPIATLKLQPDPLYKPVIPTYQLGGDDMLNLASMISLPTGEMLLNPINTSQIGDKFIFEFALSDVPDGVYYSVANVKDAYGNTWEGNVLDSKPIDRYPPEIRVFTTNGQPLSPSDPVYFFDEVIVAAVDSMSGAGEVVSAKVNGNSVLGESVAEGFEYLKRLRSSDYEISPNQDLTIALVVQDNAGNKSTAELPIRYMPVAWGLDDRSATYKRSVQKIGFPLRQTLGPGCNIYESLGIARASRTNYTYKCGVEWVSTPSGTNGGWDRRLQTLMGAFNKSNNATSENTAYYNVWMINKNGVESIAYRGEQKFDVQEPVKPLLSINTYREYKPGIFVTGVDGGYITSTTAEFDNGDLRYEIDTDSSNTIYEYSQTGFVAKQARLSRSLTVEPAPLWTDRTVKLKATYLGDKAVESEKTFRVIHAPSSSMTASLESGDVIQTNSNIIPTQLKLGIRNLRTREITFDRATMGDWTARLATESRNRDGTYEYEFLSEAKDIDDNGKASFDIDLTRYSMGGYRFLTLLEAKSPIPDYSKTIKSNQVFFQVYKGAAIDGNAQIRRIAGRAPFAAQMLFVPDSNEDRVAKGAVNWEMSTDEGATWVSIAESKDYVVKVLNEEGLYQFRAHVTNKYTGKTQYTNYQEVLVYALPDLSLTGSQALHPGEVTTIQLFDHETPADTNNADIEWSLDNGATWEAGDNSLDVEMGSELIRLQARMAYKGTELAETKRWSYIKHNILKARPLPVRIIFNQPRLMEKGVNYLLQPTVRLVDSGTPTIIKGKWKLPNGTFVEGLELEYMPTAEDVLNSSGQFEFYAWAEGYYSETLSINKFTAKMWVYEFPNFEINGGARTSYAPASGSVYIPNPINLPPSLARITYKTVWSIPSEIEVIRETDKQLVFNVTTSGQHQIKALISDDRGHSKEVMMYISVTNAPEPNLTIDPRFSNNLMREPLIVTARLNGSLGHPLDRISLIEWEVDGVKQQQIGGSIMIRDLMAGNHNITANVETNYGLKRSYTFPLSVVKNIPPTCDAEEKDYASIIRLDVKCNDSDGRIMRYEWEIDGIVLPYAGSYINVSKTAGNKSRIVVRGVDDSNAYSNSIERIYSY